MDSVSHVRTTMTRPSAKSHSVIYHASALSFLDADRVQIFESRPPEQLEILKLRDIDLTASGPRKRWTSDLEVQS